jgi:adenylosuccinate synthase
MAVVIVVGVQWGDEGKGKIVDLLTEKARLVVRWAGGANAGHTLVVEGKKYVTRLIPSGVLREGVTCVLGEGMVIDPAVLVDEIRTFRGQGFISGAHDLVVAERAHLTLPHHLEIDRLREEKGGGIGTTKKGIGPTYESKASRVALRVGDLLRPERFRTRLEAQIAAYAPYLREMGGTVPNPAEITQRYMALAEEIGPFVGDASRVVHDAVVRRDNVLFEGAQGVLLDVDHGTYPFVTSSSTTAGGACAGLGIGPTRIDRVLGVAK